MSTVDEEKRKENQRAMQKAVLQWKAEGMPGPKIAQAKIKLRAKLGCVDKEAKAAANAAHAPDLREANRVELGSQHEVVIIPVRWRQATQKSDFIDRVCQRIKKRLCDVGINAWLDARRQYTPGQKFAYWEHLGVHRRIEIGPDDFDQKVCKIVSSKTPGAYLEHERFVVKLKFTKIVKKLDQLGLTESIAIYPDKKDVDEDLVSATEREIGCQFNTPVPSEPVEPLEEEDDDDLAGNMRRKSQKVEEVPESTKKSKKRKRTQLDDKF